MTNDEVRVIHGVQTRVRDIWVGSVAIQLRYTRTDPYAVWVTLRGRNYCCARDLLLAALAGIPSGDGDVRIQCDDDDAYVEFASAERYEVIQLPRENAAKFAMATLELVPLGDESHYVDLDAAVKHITSPTVRDQ